VPPEDHHGRWQYDPVIRAGNRSGPCCDQSAIESGASRVRCPVDSGPLGATRAGGLTEVVESGLHRSRPSFRPGSRVAIQPSTHVPPPLPRIWSVLELLRWTTGYLEEKGIPEARLTTEHLLAGALGLERLDLYLQYDRPLAAGELSLFKERLRRRTRREPLQYIEGRACFRQIELVVDRRVLIPRPETELLVGEVLRWAADHPGASVVEVGTGSGAIALSLAWEGAFGRIVATDVARDALDVARDNARRLGLEDVVDLRIGPLYDPIAGERFDVIVSNPPYVALTEAEALPPEVSRWEPPGALFAGETGLDVIESLVVGAPDHLRPGGVLVLEIGETQSAAVTRRIRDRRCFEDPLTIADLTGRDRFVLAELAAPSDYSS
jgi:release factor glutamine methyltransferase